MPHASTHDVDVFNHNRISWDRQAKQQCAWSRPVGAEEVAAARNGNWHVRLTPNRLPAGWLDHARGVRILCLASGGGQQAPILAAAGAYVTVFDASEVQLQQDRTVAQRDGLDLDTVQGDMHDLSIFSDASFDLVFHPISNLYVPDIGPVWRECFRVLRSGGALLSSFYNPVVFVGDRDPRHAEQGLIHPCFPCRIRTSNTWIPTR
jgi:SAM-dependent methyltransferase